MKIQINHFDNGEELKEELAKKYHIPHKCIRKDGDRKLIIELDEDEEYRISDWGDFKREVEEKKFVNTAKIISP